MVHTPHPDADSLVGLLQDALGGGMRIERELGGGGMSRVFLVHEPALDRRLVLKVFPDGMTVGVGADRFRREIMLSAGLQHPNIVPVIAAGDAKGLPYFLMPFVEGESLRARLTRGSLLVAEAVAVLRDVGRALAYAHARGIIHRDIKPDNILLTGGAAVVVDFGVAKALADASGGSSTGDAQTLTRAGTSLGTPAYMAPEQVVADPSADQRVDLYALGVTAFEMMTGRQPFIGDTVVEVMSAHLTTAPESLAIARPGTPVALVALVAHMLEKDPKKRPASADALLRLLDDPAIVSGAMASLASVPATTPPAPVRALSRKRWSVLAFAGLAAVTGVWWASTRPDGASATTAPVIAVLPLELASSDTADSYLAQGIADEVVNALARVPGVKVASRLAARSLATAASPASAAREYGVTMTLEGSIQRRGDRVRVTARLATVSDGVAVWSETYDRPRTELFALQEEIAGSVASSVRAGVALASSNPKSETRDPAAYDDYLRGHFLLTRRGAAALREAITRFESAVERDPDFARAHAELAQAYAVLPLYAGTGREMFDRAQRAAERAIALDSTLASAHAALGYLHTANWRWKEGAAALRRAVELDSTDATAMQWYGENLLATGDATGARDAFAAAARSDREAPVPGSLEALAMSLGGQHDEAITLARRVLDANPSSVVPRLMLGTILSWAGRDGEAVPELEEAQRLAPGLPVVEGSLGAALARAGRGAEARRIVADKQRSPDAPGAQAAIARILVALGDADGAMNALRRAARARDPFFASEPLASPLFAPLRKHQQWAALMQEIGLTGTSVAR